MQWKGKLLCGVLCLLVSMEWTSGKADNDLPTVMEAIINAMVDFREDILDNLKLSLEYHTEQLEETKLYTERMMKKQLESVIGQIQELKAEGGLKVKELQESNEKLQEDLAKATQNLTEQLEEAKLMMKKQEKNVIDQIQELKTDVTQLQGELKSVENRCEKSINVSLETPPFPHSCAEVTYNVTGAYYIRTRGSCEKPFTVLCDFESKRGNGGGWIVFQRRMDGSVDFNRNWTMYKHGFGDVTGEHWLGLEKLHKLTRSGRHQLLVLLEAFDGYSEYALYDEFKIGNEADKYKLTLGKNSGTAGDALKYHNGMEFSTFDEDNDFNGFSNCAKYYEGAWWFNNCFYSHLNGKYRPKGSHLVEGVTWNPYRTEDTSLKASKMMLRSRA